MLRLLQGLHGALLVRILIYGGSFDPPHLGHMELLRAGIQELDPHKIFIVPAYASPFKDKHFARYEDRKEMLRLALSDFFPPADLSRMNISDIEGDAKRRMYTHEDVRHFRREYPDSDIWFLAGGDVLEKLDLWADAVQLANECGFIVGFRAGTVVQIPVFKNPFRIRLIPHVIYAPSGIPVSSTLIRKCIAAGEKVSLLLTPSVDQFLVGRVTYWDCVPTSS